MGKKNKGVKRTAKSRQVDFMTRLQMEVRDARADNMDFAIQMFVDDMSVALYKLLGYAGKRQRPIFEAFGIINAQHQRDVLREVRESKHDKFEPGSFPCAKNEREEMLQKIWGDEYCPYEERYEGKA